MRTVYSLNFNWEFIPNINDSYIEQGIENEKVIIVDIPHTNKLLPYNNFNEETYQFKSLYRKEIELNEDFLNKKVILTFHGVSNWAKVYINKKEIMNHMGSYTPFSKDIKDDLIIPGKNLIEVLVDSTEHKDIPPFGNIVDFLTYGGIYREVFLETRNELSIDNIYIRVENLLSKEKEIKISTTISKDTNCKIIYEIIKKNTNASIHTAEFFITDKISTHIYSLKEDVSLWDIDNPVLYTLKVKLYDSNNNLVDEIHEDFGFREAIFKNDGFYLNGRKVKLLGLNRHQSYPYVGYAMPKSMQELDAKILKNELGVNLVRTSHYPQSKHFLRACDELGLLVFEEIPGWQHIGEGRFRENTLENVKNMIIRDRNHPSIIIWGVRINESPDCDELYKKTNELAKKLDPKRATGGVRNFENSHLFEDVYTFNDFSHRGYNKGLLNPKKILPKEAPYMVTEHNGHMYPTKSFDNEQHRLNHALRHAKVIEDMMYYDNISGSIGWVMCDYNTHKDFGSGDRICYHGVLDMFRQRKLASYVYSSQLLKKPVLYISSSMSIGEYPGGELGEVYAFTNCDYIKLYKNNNFINNFYKDNKIYSHMKNPPIIIDDFIGDLLEKNEGISKNDSKVIKDILKAGVKYGFKFSLIYKIKILYIMFKYKLKMKSVLGFFEKYIGGWGEKENVYAIVGIKDEKEVIRVEKATADEARLEIELSKDNLVISDTYDVLQISIRAKSNRDNILYYSSDPVTIEASGPIEVLGPSITSLRGGQGAFYIRTTKETGIGKVIIKTTDLGCKEFSIQVERDMSLIL